MTHHNLVHKFIPMPQAILILDAKPAVDKEWKKLETIPAWQLDKVKSKMVVFLEAQRDEKKVHFMLHWWTFVISKMRSKTSTSEVWMSSRTPRWHGERRLWNQCKSLLNCSKSNGRYRKITRLWWTSSWRRISMHSGEDGGCSETAQNSKVRMSRCMDTCSTTWMAKILRQTWKIQWFLLNEIFTDTHLLDFFGKDGSRKFCWNLDGLFVHRKQGWCLSVYVDDIKLAGMKQNMAPM